MPNHFMMQYFALQNIVDPCSIYLVACFLLGIVKCTNRDAEFKMKTTRLLLRPIPRTHGTNDRQLLK